PDATGLAGQRGGGLGAAAGALRRTLPAHVALLPRRFDGELPHPPHPAVAAADVAGRRAGRPRGPALSAAPRATSAAAGRRKALPPPERGKRGAASIGPSVGLGAFGRRGTVLDRAVQAALDQQRTDVGVLAREVAEQLQRVLAAALREQGRSEAVAVGAGQAAVLL